MAVTITLEGLVYAGTLLVVSLAPVFKDLLFSRALMRQPQRAAHVLALLRELAAIVVPYIERRYPQLVGVQKMERAVETVALWLGSRRMVLARQEIEAAIEHAFADAAKNGLLDGYKEKCVSTAGGKQVKDAATKRAAS